MMLRILKAGARPSLGAIMFLACWSVALDAEPLDEWELNTSNAPQLEGIAYGQGQLIAANYGIYLSTNGLTWRNVWQFGGRYTPVYGQGRFVVPAASGGIYWSTDGINWQGLWTKVGNNFPTSVYGRGRFVLGTGLPGFVTSEDGLNWDSWFTNVGMARISGLAFGKGKYVAVGWPVGFWSENGLDWQVLDTVPTNFTFLGLTYGGGRFVGVGGGGGGIRSVSSTDGLSWTESAPVEVDQYTTVAFGNGNFVALERSGTRGGVIWTSTDGSNWRERKRTPEQFLNCVTFANGRFVIGGDYIALRSAVIPHVTDRVRFRPADCFRLQDGAMLLTVEAPYGRAVTVEASTDLLSWQTIATDPCDRGEFEVYDEDAKSLEQRFYRARQPAP